MKLSFGNASGSHIDAELLSDYLDNQITPEQRSRIDQHLSTCAACRAELNSLRQTVALLHALPRVPVPRAFTLSEAQVGARRRSTSWIWGGARVMGAVAALVVVAALAVLVVQRPGQQAAPLPVAMAPAQVTAAAGAPTAAPQAATAAEGQPQAKQALPDTAEPVPAPQAIAPKAATTAQDRGLTTGGSQTGPAATAVQPQATAPVQASPAPSSGPESQPAAALALAPEGGTQTPGLAAAPYASNPATPPAFGRGGGGVGPAGSGFAPETLPPSAAPSAVLPQTAGIVYADAQGLQAIDTNGTHLVVATPDIIYVTVAPDRAWIAYRVPDGNSADLWTVQWDGSQAHRLASEASFPAKTAGAPAEPRVIGELDWIPATHNLAFPVTDINSGAVPKNELWSADPAGNAPHYVTDLGAYGSFAYSPNGRTIAVLDRGDPTQMSGGKLTLVNADGSNPRTALKVPALKYNYMTETQLSWLPDSSALWAAIPNANAGDMDHPVLDLYRISLNGQAQRAGQIQAMETVWSPNGQSLAYTGAAANNPSGRQLFVANADGSHARVYDNALAGTVTSWSPDSQHFLYTNNEQYYLGTPGAPDQKPRSLGHLTQPDWVAADQVLALLNEVDSWALVSHTVDGQAATLAQLPQGGPVFDVTQR